MLAIIIVLIIIIVVLIHKNRTLAHEYLKGFWRADEAYAASAGADEIMLYVGEGGDTHLLVIGGEEISQTFKMEYSAPFITINPSLVNMKARISGDEPVWGVDTVKLRLDINAGLLTITNGEEILAILYKDNEVSDLAI